MLGRQGAGSGLGSIGVSGCLGLKGGGESTFSFPAAHSLATAQHLRSTLVSLVNPGLVGISLKGRERTGSGDRLELHDEEE